MIKNIPIKFCLFAMIGQLLVTGSLSALPANKIKSATFFKSSKIETVKIYTSRQPKYTISRLNNPDRLVLNFDNTFLPEVHFSQDINSEKIKRVRISQNTKKQSRVVIDLKKDAVYKTNLESYKNGTYALEVSFDKVLPTAISAGSISAPSPAQKIEPVLMTDMNPNGSVQAKNKKAVSKTKAGTTADITPPKTTLPDEPKTIVMLGNETDLDALIQEANEDNEQQDKDLSLGGTIQIRGSHDTSNNQINENRNSFKNRTILKAKYKKSFVVSGISDYLYFSNDDQTDEYNLELFETYYKSRGKSWDFSIGKQIKRWGKTDQISPIDTLNPENLTESFIPAYEERKIPVWMAELKYKKDDFFIEGILIPFFEPAKFDYFGTDWAVFSHIKANINDSSLSSGLKTYFNDISVNEHDPDHELDNMEYALRFGGALNNVDFGFTYHYAFEDFPTITSFPVKNLSISNPSSTSELLNSLGSLTLTGEQIEAQYLRTHMAGFEFETTVSEFGVRGEISIRENESFLTRSFTSVRNPTTFWILGMDYTGANDLYVNFQLGQQHIADFNSDILFYEEDNYFLVGEVKRDMFVDWVTGSVRYTYMLNDQSSYISPRLSYTYFDNFECVFGLNLYQGDDNSILGQYDKNDQLFIDVLYQF